MPSSPSPGGRAYFGYWQSGFHLYITGGEGPASTVQDSWTFNFYTKVSLGVRTRITFPSAI
jgi:hypothetical protein